jgi:hypothetical protein
MGATGYQKSYTSPKHKLLNFFERSRDKWKAKCLEAKVTVKRLKNRVRFLECSKEAWKEKTHRLEAEIAQLKARLPAAEKEAPAQKKRN